MERDGRWPVARRGRMVLGFVLAIGAMVGSAEVFMSQASASVRANGGFVDGSGWQGVYKALNKDGKPAFQQAEPTRPTLFLDDRGRR